jgi:hypothetical protein
VSRAVYLREIRPNTNWEVCNMCFRNVRAGSSAEPGSRLEWYHVQHLYVSLMNKDK